MKAYTIIFFILVFQYLQGQPLENVKFGEFSPTEIGMKSYSGDTEAKAVVLYDKGEAQFIEYGGQYEILFTRHLRIKVFDKSLSGIDEIEISLYRDGYALERVRDIRASTYNKSYGQLIESQLDKKSIYEEQISDNIKIAKFVLPNIQDGSILEISYTVQSPFLFRLPDWRFQSKIPTIYSEYEVALIPFFEYVFIAKGISKFDYYKAEEDPNVREYGSVTKAMGQNLGSGFEFKDMVHTYVLRDVPAFDDESYITSVNDYIIQIDFQLAKIHYPNGSTENIISTWPELNKRLLKEDDFGKYLKQNSRIAKKILNESASLTAGSDAQKAESIVKFVTENYSWNGFQSKRPSQAAKDFERTRNGNTADINLFLIAMLREAGIDADPVILSTRENGKIQTDYPFDHYTNYIVALVKIANPFMADATASNLPFNRIPSKCYNELGLIVDESEEPNWIELINNIPSVEKYVISSSFDPETNNINTQVSIQSTEYMAFENRSAFDDVAEDIIRYYSNKIGEIEKVRTAGYKKSEHPYSINLLAQHQPELLSDNIIFKPFFDLPFTENPFKQKTRNYPVDFAYPKTYVFNSIFNFPEGYTPLDLPEKIEVDNSIGSLMIKHESTGNSIQSTAEYSFNEAIYAPELYARLKYHMERIVEEMNRSIVIKKQD